MARRRRSGVALAAAGTIGVLLVGFELLVRHTRVGASGARTPTSLVSEVLADTTSFVVTGWPALLVPVGLVLLLGLLVDALSGSRR